jgi:hypothetical protein
MKTLLRSAPRALLGVVAMAAAVLAADETPAPAAVGVETLEAADGTRTPGRLEGDPSAGFRFIADGSNRPTPLRPGATVLFPGRGTATASGLPPFRVEMGLGQRLSGRLSTVSDREIRLVDMAGEARLTVARTGAHALVQRPGETQVFQDGFEAIDTTRWTVLGEPEVAADPHIAGEKGLRVPSGGASMTHRLSEPFGSGRLEIAFHDDGRIAVGQQWFVDLTFRSATGPETIRAVLGWAEDSLAVESPGGPALAVQRLARKAGWHRLVVRFGPDLSEIGVDGNELAHGKGFGGPLVEVRLASYRQAKAPAPDDLAGHFDDLRLVRFAGPVGGMETDVTQDEVRLTGGDQLFGKIRSADGESVGLTIAGRDISLSWGEVAGLYFRRAAAPVMPVEGLLVKVEWHAAPGADPRERNLIEGALTGLTRKELTVSTPYAGTITVRRDRVTALHVLGRGRRLVLDPLAHHLGDEISTIAPILDPPQPEGGVLERTAELADVPQGAAFLVLDVVQVVGEATDLPFSTLVKKGELRTNVKINGEPFDYLNHYITSKNETSERIRLAIPKGLLRPGKNVVRLEQAGIASDPNFLDDLGILTVAIEFPDARTDSKPR